MSRGLVLIIEDDYDVAVIFAKAARNAGCDVQVVRAGDTGMIWLQADAADVIPDIVVLDLFLPRVSGEQILNYIRQQEHLNDTKVIVATAYPQLEDSVRGRADLVVHKPILPKKLQQAIEGLLDADAKMESL